MTQAAERRITRAITLHRLPAPILFGLIALAFVLVNKAAFQAFFSDDDLENLALSRYVPWRELLTELVSPRLNLDNYRPVGQLFYRLLGATAGLHYGPFVAAIQCLHLLTAGLVWLYVRELLRRTGRESVWATAAGCLVFAFHGSVLGVYWKPMYVFDLLCALFCVLSLLAWQHGRWLLAFFSFWLAYKSKELAIMLPAVLVVHESLFPRDHRGVGRRWLAVVPFLLVSLSFGLQAIFRPARPNNDYTMHFTMETLRDCAAFYAPKLLLNPVSAFFVAGVLFTRERLAYFGVAIFWLLLTPMLFLPGRLMSAYLYVPLLGVALAIAAFTRAHPRYAVAFLLFWLPVNYLQFREERKPILALGHAHRPYVEQIAASLRQLPPLRAAVYEGAPLSMGRWGTSGLLRFTTGNPNLQVYYFSDPQAMARLREPGTALFTWDFITRQLRTSVYPGAEAAWSYVDFSRDPVWPLGKGWYGLDGKCRWSEEHAEATLSRPAGTSTFLLRFNLGGDQVALYHQQVSVTVQEVSLAAQPLAGTGMQEFRWTLPPGPAGQQLIRLHTEPGFQSGSDPRRLGLQVCALGFQ